jgi:hypothetical protein
MDLLLDSIHDVSLAATGRRDSIEGVTYNSSPALLWVLRDMKNFQHFDTFDSEILSPVIISRELDNFPISQDIYRGQDFILATESAWTGAFPPDWISWIAFREGPLIMEHIILWVRNDVMSGN